MAAAAPTVSLHQMPPAPSSGGLAVVSRDGLGRAITVEQRLDPRIEAIYTRLKTENASSGEVYLHLNQDARASFWSVKDGQGQVVSRGRLIEVLTDAERKDLFAYTAVDKGLRRGQLATPLQSVEETGFFTRKVSGGFQLPDREKLTLPKKFTQLFQEIGQEIQKNGTPEQKKKWEPVVARSKSPFVQFAIYSALKHQHVKIEDRFNLLKAMCEVEGLGGKGPFTKEQEKYLHEVVAFGIKDLREQKLYLEKHKIAPSRLTIGRFLVEKLLQNDQVTAQELMEEARRTDNFLAQVLPSAAAP